MNSNFVNLMDSPNFLFHSNTKLTQLTEMQFYRSIVRWSILLFLYFCVYLYRNLFCICHFAIHFGWHFNSFFSKFATFSSGSSFHFFFFCKSANDPHFCSPAASRYCVRILTEMWEKCQIIIRDDTLYKMNGDRDIDAPIFRYFVLQISANPMNWHRFFLLFWGDDETKLCVHFFFFCFECFFTLVKIE